jgi:glyoxylase-like metal-dependent hydrolase (beta-lactamase superfamily II)
MSDIIKPINLEFVNAFLVQVLDGYILIDSGVPAQWKNLDKQLVCAGCLPGKLKLVIITHGDWDHTGNCAALQKKYQAPIAMHQADAFMAQTRVLLKRRVKTLSRRIIFFFIRLMMKLRAKQMVFHPFKPDILLSDGQSLAPYGFAAKVVHIPGHTKGSIGVLTDAGAFFAGDTFVNREGPVTAEIIQDDAELKASLARLKSMDIKTVYPGHGQPFEMSSL